MDRDKQTVLLDVLAAMADFHEDSPLGEAYFSLYQAVGMYILAKDLKPVQEHYEAIREAFAKLPEPDASVVGLVLDDVLGE